MIIARNPIHIGRLLLQQAMPVDCGAFVWNVVRNCHFDPIAPIRLNGRTWKLVVYQNASVFIQTIWITRYSVDGPGVMSGYTRIRSVFVVVSVLH